jgi:hypothetical protein
MSELTNEIKSKGFWQVVIRPTIFSEERISDYGQLLPILQKSAVGLRGWDFPHIDSKTEVVKQLHWIGQETDWEYFREAWRFHQSGQFAYLVAIHEDWAERSHGWAPREEHDRPLLGIGDAVFRFTEIFEFAARLSLTDAGDAQMHIDVSIHGLNGRSLWQDDRSHRSIRETDRATIEAFPYGVNVSRDTLASDAWNLALTPAKQLFLRFGWNPSTEVLRDLQSGLRHARFGRE